MNILFFPFLQRNMVIAISAALCIGVSSVANAAGTIVMNGSTGTAGAVIPPVGATDNRQFEQTSVAVASTDVLDTATEMAQYLPLKTTPL